MRRLIAFVLCGASLMACAGEKGTALCSGRVSVADFVLRFGQGLANMDDAESMDLRADSVSVLDVLLAAREGDTNTSSAARSLSAKVAGFIAVMNADDWVISVALDDTKAVAAADALSGEAPLREANTVEAYVLGQCPTASTSGPPGETFETLPAPSVPSPTATDPPDSGQKEQSQAESLGALVGTTFGITMSAEQVKCVGTALQDVVDATQAQSGPGQYAEQYQSAFDSCGVDFEVPSS